MIITGDVYKVSIRNNMKQKLKHESKQIENHGRLLVKCPDKPGIVAVLSNFYLNTNRILWSNA